MKNVKCVIGASLLAPVVVAILLFFCSLFTFFFMWLGENFTFFPFLLGSIVLIVLIVFAWFPLYDHCIEHNKKKED